MSTRKHFDFPYDAPSVGTVKAQCKYCKTIISGNIKTISNFVTHLKKKHRAIYIASKLENEPATSQPSINNFMKSASTFKYTPKDPHQKAITDALVHYVAGNLLPLSIVESSEFKELLQVLDPKYQLPSRKHISTKLLHEKPTAIQTEIKSKLHRVQSISLTIDMWSNRQMKGYLGITGHFILDWTMKSVMIACKRFKGRHTADNIRQEYEEAIEYYEIGEKICNIISDNASNMTKAFEFTLPGYMCESEKVAVHSDSEDETDDENHDDIDLEDTL